MNAYVKFSDLDRLESMARDFLPERTAVTVLDLRGEIGAMMPCEETAVSNAVAKRQREFAGGRAAARKAMSILGLPAVGIPKQKDRSPKWPEGVVGSISHCDRACISAVARAPDMVTLGIDIEEATPLDENLLSIICIPAEIDWLNRQPEPQRMLLAKLIFSAKEAAYKCQYPLSRELFGFEGFKVKLNTARQTFTATFQCDAHPFAPGNKLIGRYVIEYGFILTAVWIKAFDASSEQTAAAS